MKDIAEIQKKLRERWREECRNNDYLRKLSEAEDRRRERVIYGFAPDTSISQKEAEEDLRLERVHDDLLTWNGHTNHIKNY